MFGAKAATEKFAQQVTQKTGLRAEGDKFVGEFQGLPAWAQTQMVTDVVGAVTGKGGMLGGLGALVGGSAGGMMSAMTGGQFFMKHDYVVELPSSYPLPGASLRETTSFLVNKGLQQRASIGPKTRCGVQWIDAKYEVCSNHQAFIEYTCSFDEFQTRLRDWPYVNLTWNGTQVWLESLDSGTRIHGKFGTEAMQNGNMVLQGLSLASAAARGTLPR